MPNDAGQDRSPADIRAVFSQNLKELMGASPNAPALCRELSLNRTQFNRYLAGESFRGPIFCKNMPTFRTGCADFIATVV
jgi:hypothetical protein